MRALSFQDFLYLLLAARWTIVLSVVAFVGGGLIGAAVALARVSHRRSLWLPAMVYIRIFQGTPLLVQLFLIFFGVGVLGLSLGPLLSATLGLSFNAGAFLGEIWRGAIQSVDRGQVEAAIALDLRYWPRMTQVIVPQAVRLAIPPTVGFIVVLVKNTSLAALIGFVELSRAAQMVNNTTYRPFTIFGIVAALYFLMCWPLTSLSRRLERRVAQAYQ
jgi:polar amino acid transport system permease protein